MFSTVFLLISYRTARCAAILRPMQECCVEITGLAYRGSGVGRLDGKVVFVPHTIPGERARVRTVKSSRRFDEAELIAVEQPAPQRITPACPYAGHCLGCSYQHMDYTAEPAAKNNQLRDFLRRVPSLTPDTLLPPVTAPSPLHYRNKIVLHTQHNADSFSLGYIGADNHSVLPVTTCALAVPEIEQALAQWQTAPDAQQRLSDAQRITFRQTEANGVSCWDAAHPPAVTLIERTILGPLHIPAAGFFQVNRPVADLLMQTVTDHLRRLQPDSMLDLFCGSGLFALAAAVSGIPQVSGIDSDRDSIRHARRNAEALGVPSVRFAAAPAEQGLRALPKDITRGTRRLWLVDPPRQGLDARTLALILKNRPEHLIYVSCAPDTLARDLSALCTSAYHLEHAQLFDMFPRTYGFETLTVLTRQP